MKSVDIRLNEDSVRFLNSLGDNSSLPVVGVNGLYQHSWPGILLSLTEVYIYNWSGSGARLLLIMAAEEPWLDIAGLTAESYRALYPPHCPITRPCRPLSLFFSDSYSPEFPMAILCVDYTAYFMFFDFCLFNCLTHVLVISPTLCNIISVGILLHHTIWLLTYSMSSIINSESPYVL